VTAFTISIAKAVPVPLPYLPVLARAAFLHDIGKMAIPDMILRKPGPLDNDEKTIMRTHCEIGYNMLTKILFFATPRRSSWPTRNFSMAPVIPADCAASRFPRRPHILSCRRDGRDDQRSPVP